MSKSAILVGTICFVIVIALLLDYRSKWLCLNNNQGFTIGVLANNDFDNIESEEYINYQYEVKGQVFNGASLIRIPDKEVVRFENGNTFVVVYCNNNPRICTIILEYPFEGDLGQKIDNKIEKEKIKINFWSI